MRRLTLSELALLLEYGGDPMGLRDRKSQTGMTDQEIEDYARRYRQMSHAERLEAAMRGQL